MRVILSLCDYSGLWPKPYREAGYMVILVDPKHKKRLMRCNLLKLPYTVETLFSRYLYQLPPVYGILMAPPCTHFTRSGAQDWKAKDEAGLTARGMATVEACLNIKDALAPTFWVLENPVGRLPRLFPERLGAPRMYFNPCDYGDPYTKRTGLWGDFNTDLPKRPVKPKRVSSQGSWVQRLGGASARTKELRSNTPLGFARAFFEVNK